MKIDSYCYHLVNVIKICGSKVITLRGLNYTYLKILMLIKSYLIAEDMSEPVTGAFATSGGRTIGNDNIGPSSIP